MNNTIPIMRLLLAGLSIFLLSACSDTPTGASGGNELWQELYAPFNLIPVRSGNSGTQMFGWFNREINSLADLRGLNMRIPGLGGEVMSRAGATTVTMQASEVFTAMQTGALDATEFVSAYNDLAAGYHTVADYYYYPGWLDPGDVVQQGQIRGPAR